MKRLAFGVLAVAAFGTAVTASSNGTHRAQAIKPAASHAPALLSPDQQNQILNEYCLGCHDEDGRAGGLSLEDFNPAHPEKQADTAEKMIRKLRAGMMPPVTAPKHPAPEVQQAFAAALEARIDAAAAANPNPGRRVFQRLNRAEYKQAVQDMLDLTIDVDAFLPPDTLSDGFDNIADSEAFSPMLMEGYLRAASKIASLAVGERNASPTEATYKVPRTESQMHHIEGTPWGTRGGVAVDHIFPADGDYTFRMLLHGVPTGQLYGSTVRGEQIEVSIDGQRVVLLPIDYRMSETDKNGLNLTTPSVHVTAGPHTVAAAFIQRFEAPVDDLLSPIEYTLADSQIGDGFGVTTLPHLRDFSITGPFHVTGVSDTVSRRRIFTCRPTAANEEAPCAESIVGRLAGQAYRAPVTPAEVADLMRFYDQGRKGGDFESGVRMALQAILASPRFLFRLEEVPTTLRASATEYRINDLDLASRLSFFIWDAPPDAELLKVAGNGTLHTPAVLDKQVRRMLADPQSEALSTRFAAEWLRLQDVDKIRPDALLFPSYDYRLAQGYTRETELFFDSIVREDRNILDLLTADYTFVNERVAKQYGIPNVTGDKFRRVELGPAFDMRRGLLGKGSILMLTAVADRTSPVQRGKWIMTVLLGSPPPPPPPNVPALEATAASAGGRTLSVRERMEEHRKSPACASCHRIIDPLGLALDNFDVTGAWRIKDNGVAVDANGTLYDGTKIEGVAGLRQALLNRRESVIRNFTENLMAYAVGRRVEYYDEPTVRAIVRGAAANDNRFSQFVLGIVDSPAFQMAKVEPVRTTENATDNAGSAKAPSRR